MLNPFFKNVGPFNIEKLLNKINIENKDNFVKDKIYNVSDLVTATNKDLTFFHSKKYCSFAAKTKASYCVTLDNLSQFLPKSCNKIIVKNVLLTIAKITKEFYPKSIVDEFDETAKDISKTSLKNKVKFGKNVLIGKNVKIGKSCSIGHNSIIEKNVTIGSNCSIGSNVIIRNTIVKDNVNILDGCVIGKKGFGFFPNKDLTFFHSKNYSELASKTKASYCITLDNLSHFLPSSCKKIIVKNVLLTMAKITKEFYPKSIVDDFDESVKDISKTSFKKKNKIW